MTLYQGRKQNNIYYETYLYVDWTYTRRFECVLWPT